MYNRQAITLFNYSIIKRKINIEYTYIIERVYKPYE